MTRTGWLWFALIVVMVVAGGAGAARPASAAPPLHPEDAAFQTGFPRLEPRSAITFASPTVVDLNGDGRLDVLVADGAGCVWGYSHTGEPLPGFPWTTTGACEGPYRINSSLAVGDVNGDGEPEVVAGTHGNGEAPGQRGKVFVWRLDGRLLPGWPQEMAWRGGDGHPEVYSVALANVAGDGRLEILAGTSNNGDGAASLYAWYGDGALLPGYPTVGRNAGIYGMIGAADLTGDGLAEVIAGRDHHYVYAYDERGQDLAGWPVRTYVDPNRTTWGEDPFLWYTRNAPSMADLDGDGSVETVIAGKISDPRRGYAIVQSGIIVLEANGQRRAGWEIPQMGGAPLHSDWDPSQAPALGDLDGDGVLDIVVALFDGTIRAYRADGTLLWLYDYARGKRLFASEPVIGDVTGDGVVDVLFGTYSPDGSAHDLASLVGLSATGQPLPGFPLRFTEEGQHLARGLRAAPTLADLDGDGDVEVLAASQAGTLYVWDLPAPYRHDRLPWPTARGSALRNGTPGMVPPPPPATHPSMRAQMWVPLVIR